MADGLVISSTDPIRSFLVAASGDRDHLSDELRILAASLSVLSSVPYKSLRSIWCALPVSSRPSLRVLLDGSDFVFTSPKPRVKSEELKARLQKLAELVEQREYTELVKDVVPKKDDTEPFSSYKDQIGFGLHVVLVMFTGYLVGYATFRALFNHNPIMNAAGGILGLVGGMLLETVLFIIRASTKDMVKNNATSSASRLKIKKHQ
ncbi:Endoplasmic reticulum-based factor for assembly of V-ATPase [Carex littledalei]|uniref:Endoplasmic reticulum-based factor for assembly of V-ATPase n=1 Tax=Carex littledalei TaxID=544730 RepID=A0A833VEM1_9POAL|nr:Endoplasmic reticulum-based factor for assembly of V-ATPase [Carex littledalei]